MLKHYVIKSYQNMFPKHMTFKFILLIKIFKMEMLNMNTNEVIRIHHQ